MSYCRWSSDDSQCDVYCYESTGGGWITHVAGRRRRLRDGVSLPPHVEQAADPHAWVDRYRLVNEIIGDANEGVLWDWEDLPGPHAGESYRDESAGECADRLEEIRASGLSVPQYAIDTLREEEAEAVATPQADGTP